MAQFGIFSGLRAAVSGASAPESGVDARVLLIGVDGASWKVIGPMIENGKLSTLARFVKEGAHCRSLRSLGYID